MEIILVALSIMSISFFAALIFTINRLKVVSSGFSKLFLDYTTLQATAQLDKELSKENEDTHKENFIKFLSDSREWAYDYIDSVQKELKTFIDIADKEFAYFDKYGMLSEGELHYETMKIISEEYKKLKFLLPKEADDRR